jgi:hypothetical protein
LGPEGKKVLFAQVLEELHRRGINVEGLKLHPEVQGPRTDDELWAAVYQLTGYRIPRVAVCEGHVAPFTIFADLYYDRRSDVLMIGNRGGGKTTVSGFLHGAKSNWKPGYTTAIAGALEKQADRAYAEFQRFTGHLAEMIVESLRKKTRWAHGSENEVLVGTIKSVNGPHPHLAQFDELELTTGDVFEEWQNMSQGDVFYAGQNLLSSTRKRPYGLVQGLVKECEDAAREGNTPPWDVMTFCVFETMANVPNCGQRREDGSLICGCDKVVKGRWVDGRIRDFASVCGGRAKRADGFMQLKDIHRRFRGLSRRTWEAQQECLRPSTEGLVHTWWDPELHELPFWFPRPEYGPIYRSWDWGGTNPHSVHWSQQLKVDVYLRGPKGKRIHVPEGVFVTFDEVFHSGGGAYSLGLEVMERTMLWHSYGYRIEIEHDFCDPANPTAKADVRKAAKDGGYPEPDFRSIPSTIETSVDKHIEWGEDGKLRVVGRMCPNLVEEYETYHWPEIRPGQKPPTKPVQVDDHAVDDQRYRIWNLYRLFALGSNGSEAPVSDYSEHFPRNQAQEQKAIYDASRTWGESPVASSMSPGYARESPHVSRATVRRHKAMSVRQTPGAPSGNQIPQ